MSTVDAKIWIPAKWDEKEKKWVPVPELARQIIPTIDDKRIEKWVDEYTVELAVQEVRLLARVPIFVGRERTILPPVKKLEPTTLLEAVLEVDGREICRFYISEKMLNNAIEEARSDLMLKDYEYLTNMLKTIVIEATLVVTGLLVDITIYPKDLEKLRDEGRIECERVGSMPSRAIYLTGNRTRGWFLIPGWCYQLVCEWVRIPNDMIVKDVKLRSSYRRPGWDGHPSNIEPGFEGHIIYTIHAPETAPPLVIEEGARAITMRLYKLEKPAGGYKGQFQGV